MLVLIAILLHSLQITVLKCYLFKKFNALNLKSFGDQNSFGVNFLRGKQLNSTFNRNLKCITFYFFRRINSHCVFGDS